MLFDDAEATSAGVEPAILDGVRVTVDTGIIVASARHADRFTGFRALPSRLGGGIVAWSEDRIYRASSWLEEPRPVVDLGAVGARPWLGSVVLRTPLGLVDLDPASLAIHRLAWPGVADAIALDDKRAARVDVLGRAEITTDGGATWTDLLATRGVRAERVRLDAGAKAIVITTSAGGDLRLSTTGALRPADRRSPGPPEVHTTSASLDAAWPASRRALPSEIVAQAIAWGAPLPGGLALVAREGGARVISTSTGLAVADVDLPRIDERFARCQAVSLGSSLRAGLACASDRGAHVVAIEGSLSALALDATFPRRSGGFFAGPRGLLALDGPCGPSEPRALDLGPSASKAASEPAEPASAPAEEAPDDDARVCVRGPSATWFERRLGGDDARGLYRWIPGEGGAITALVLVDRAADPKPEAPRASPEGVRVVRVDPNDPALAGGAFPAVPEPSREAPYRTIDADFWMDHDGSIRGWVKLPADGEEAIDAPKIAQGAAKRALRVATARGGRSAGARIDPAGKVTLFAIPEGTAEVVTGGAYAIAMALRDGVPSWFESIDGGATWTPIEGPPTGRLDAPTDERAPFGCSPLGCALGNGIVRLGWGGPRPSPPADLALAPAAAPKPRDPPRPALRCRLEGDLQGPANGPKALENKAQRDAPLSLRGATTTLGEVKDHAWSAEVIAPFAPSSAPRRVSARDASLTSNKGAVVPLLTGKPSAPVDLLVTLGDRRARVGNAAPILPLPISARLGIAAEIEGGALALLDTDHDQIFLARGALVAPVVRLTRVADAARTRITIAHKLSGGLAIVGVATSSGDVVAGDLDLGRAEVGPLARLAGIDRIAPAGAPSCASAKATHRALIEIPIDVRLEGTKGGAPIEHRVTAAMLVAAGPDHLCVEGVEAAIPGARATILSALLGSAPAASVRRGAAIVKASCALAAR